MSAGLEFFGAAGTVTGSKTIVRSSQGTAVIDFGMFQGFKALRETNWQEFPVPPDKIDGVALTHAHIDHTGLLPRLEASGYRGAIHATSATNQLLEVLLPDAAKIQEEDADFVNRHSLSKHVPAKPLYTMEDAMAVLQLLRSHDRTEEVALAPGISTRFKLAGHILGSAWLDTHVQTSNGIVRAVFSGDLGPRHSLIMPQPDPVLEADVMVIESTYGDRDHPLEKPEDIVRSVIQKATERRSVVVVPAFAVDRTEDLLYLIRYLEDEGSIQPIPVWVDSPMAASVFHVYEKHADEIAPRLRDEMRSGKDPFAPAMLQFTRGVEDSKRLNNLTGPAVIIASSGMATGGRVLHHLKRRLSDPSTTVLLCGFQSPGTRGRQLADGAGAVKIQGEQVPVRARVLQVHSLSSHADRGDLLAWLSGVKNPPKMVFPVHGEEGPRAAIAASITRELGWHVLMPEPGTVVTFTSLGLE
ncbi:MAG: MBL fold metallo-hydrolase [Actinomycetota bacterium]